MNFRYYGLLCVCFVYIIMAVPLQGATMDSIDLTVMSFNVQMTEEYERLNKKQMVADLIMERQADIIGFQEYQYRQLKELAELLPDYAWFGVGRDNGKTKGEMGPILYRKDDFELIEENTFWLSQYPEIPGTKSWDAACPRIVTWGRFKDLETGRFFYVFNTHFDHWSSLAREKSSELLLDKINEITKREPVIVTGDFNFNVYSEACGIILEGINPSLKLFTAKELSRTGSFGPSGSYNGYSNPNTNNKIDFIFVNPFIKVNKHGIINDRPNGIYISDHFPVLARMTIHYPVSPSMPELKANGGDGVVNLSWNRGPHETEIDPLAGGVSDFEGYKLYRFTRPSLIEGGDSIEGLGEPLFQGDLINGVKGYASYGIVNGDGFYLGGDKGLSRFYQDTSVINGVTYYYVLTAYDRGDSKAGLDLPPLESPFILSVDSWGKIIERSKNVAIVKPLPNAAGYMGPEMKILSKRLMGAGEISLEVVDKELVKAGHTYKLVFHNDTVSYLRRSPINRHPSDRVYTCDGFSIYDLTEDALVYQENPVDFEGNNFFKAGLEETDEVVEYDYLNPNKAVSGVFDGIRLKIENSVGLACHDSLSSGWLDGDCPLKVLPVEGYQYFPWEYQIVFTNHSSEYESRTTKTNSIYSYQNEPLGPGSLILGKKFNFYVINKCFKDSLGDYEKLDLIACDRDGDGEFDFAKDRVLAGHVVDWKGRVYWGGTVFELDFSQVPASGEFPISEGLYQVSYKRPFLDSDSLLFTVKEEEVFNSRAMKSEMDEIKVVPNPYVAANAMENNTPGGRNRRIMFTRVPGKCEIRIYTVSGVLTRVLRNNDPVTGGLYWDLKSRDGDEVAPGYYIYYVKALNGGEEKVGKFAVIK